MAKEIVRRGVNGIAAFAVLMLVLVALMVEFVRQIPASGEAGPSVFALSAIGVGMLLVLFVGLPGLFTVQPNQGKVLTLFGRYVGTVKEAGLWWANPFLAKRAISLRVRNFETAKLKVNDKNSNPIEIGAIVVWQVVDTAEALFEVDNYEDYVRVQSESAVRTLASSYPYDAHQEGERSLSHNASEISDQLAAEVQNRLERAGMQVLEARIAHLAYAPEIANAMLRRQQASAIIAARTLIVEGAVSMVELALKSIVEKGIVTLDEERKAMMVSNLLVTLCAEQPMQPVVNTGAID
jgi:regulator of protease activity HflC (stomatin/prohibitin superfamily)